MPTPSHSILRSDLAARVYSLIAHGEPPPAPEGCVVVPYDPAHEGLPVHALPEPPPAPRRVLKDTIVQRIKAHGKLSDLAALVATLTPEQRFEFDHSTWFSSDNALIVGGVQALGLDPADILAADPLAP